MKKQLNLLLVLAAAVFSLCCTGDLMRKCDQATILAGAHDLVHGSAQAWSAYYQYDKSYILYWACAAVMKLAPHISPIAACNVSLAALFWLALLVFVIRFRDRLSFPVLLCFLSAPAVLLNTLYVNSSVLSSAFLLFSACFLFNERRQSEWPAALFFFLAVGSRSDVILLLPLILWLITPFPTIGKFFSNDWKKKLKTGLAGSRHWKLIAAGAAALVLGPLLAGGSGTALDLFFNWKMVAGYAVFGFGAAGLLFLVDAVQFIAAAVREPDRLKKLWLLGGLAAFLLPVLFFIPQLHTPRYFWRGCEALLLLSVSGCLPVLKLRPLQTAIGAFAVLFLILGIRLPQINRPEFTLTNPTLFPSGDGFYPMGTTLPFLVRLHRADETPLDHNQQVWNAVHAADLETASDGGVHVLFTPMYGYFMLEASLRGVPAYCRPFDSLTGKGFYADSRSLMRNDPKTPLLAQRQILSLPAEFVSPVSEGIGVLRFGAGDHAWGRQTQLLNRLFAGNEYRISTTERTSDSDKKTVWFSAVPFAGAQHDAESGVYWTFFLPEPVSTGVFCAEAVFPGWMSLQAFNGSGQ
jgi:hypothetical protein